MATVNAAAAGNVPGRKLGLAPGERADVVQFTIEANQLQIQAVWIGGVQQAIPQAC
jgi:alpha-D-ribose 1-methylphosphonate 5-triphosphate diphosphatase PhnM